MSICDLCSYAEKAVRCYLSGVAVVRYKSMKLSE